MERDSHPLFYHIVRRAVFALLIGWVAGFAFPVLAQTPEVPIPSPRNIKDDLRHESLKDVLTGVAHLKEGKVGEIINRFSGKDAAWVWTVQEGVLPKNTNAVTLYTQTGMVTTLNYASLKSATKLSVARTLIHEMIHAYLVLYFRTDTTAATVYPRIAAAYRGAVPAPDQNEVHHREMAISFVDEIAAALRAYGRRLGLQVDDSVYTDLAWGGLDFHNNDALADENKLRIQRRLTAEQNIVPVFPEIHPTGPPLGD